MSNMAYKVTINNKNEKYSLVCSNIQTATLTINGLLTGKFIKITIEPYKESFIDLEKSNYEKIE